MRKCLVDKILTDKTMVFWQGCLAKVATSVSKMNEKNGAVDDPNGLASGNSH